MILNDEKHKEWTCTQRMELQLPRELFVKKVLLENVDRAVFSLYRQNIPRNMIINYNTLVWKILFLWGSLKNDEVLDFFGNSKRFLVNPFFATFKTFCNVKEITASIDTIKISSAIKVPTYYGTCIVIKVKKCINISNIQYCLKKFPSRGIRYHLQSTWILP